MKDSFRRGGFGRAGQDSLGQVEHEGLRGDQVVPDRPTVRRQDRQEGGRARRIELPQGAVVRSNRSERGPVGSGGVVEEDRESGPGGHRSGEVRAHEERIHLRGDHRPDVDRLGPARVEDDETAGAARIRVDGLVRGDLVVRHIVSRRDEGQHGGGVRLHLVFVQVQLDPVSVDETLQGGQEEARRQVRARFHRDHVKHRSHPENRKWTLSRRHARLARAARRRKDPQDVRAEHADDQEGEDRRRNPHGAVC